MAQDMVVKRGRGTTMAQQRRAIWSIIGSALTLALLAGCAAQGADTSRAQTASAVPMAMAQATPAAAPAPAPQTTPVAAAPSAARRPQQPTAVDLMEFARWRTLLRGEALAAGVSPATFDEALGNVEPNPRVLELDRKQPETTQTFDDYLTRTIPQSRVNQARQRLKDNSQLLSEVSQRYGVPARYIVALWAMESDFGRYMGDFSVVTSLATLAFDGKRSSLFRKELISALQILDQHKIPPSQLRGSWAGAMGQSQFMPSSYQRYAVDYDKDGKADIWNSQADVFASIANYLASEGWRGDQVWGRQVQLPAAMEATAVGLDKPRDIDSWSRAGVRRVDGSPLPAAAQSMQAAVVQPGGPGGKAYLVYDNYRIIMKWNRSTYFATAIGLLADRIGDG